MSTIHDKEGKIRVGISIGDLNGVGPEVIIKTFSDTRMLQLCTPYIYTNPKVISFYRKLLNLNDFNFNSVKTAANAILRKVNVVSCWDEDVAIEPGKIDQANGKFTLKSFVSATDDLIEGKIDCLVTAPLNKQQINLAGIDFIGHTEYLADAAKTKSVLMIMASETLRLGVVTGHLPLKKVSEVLTTELILQKLKMLNLTLKKDFGITRPRIAILGLNPHAGDDGLLGSEEKDIIIPAMKLAEAENIYIFGPYSADGFFGSDAYRKFDAVLAMYHDQGLIPFKAISFSSGVNFTAGLPFVRTSPDHGTAYDIAGKNKADESSFRHAVYMACDILQRRAEYAEITKNPLKFSKLGSDQ